ncbi:MAG: DUF4163 domain-containing protein [Alphaproteobacteria bacterium]|nr:DUF4163 domain-containing protein [Alphaproteobacteria bacterium]
MYPVFRSALIAAALVLIAGAASAAGLPITKKTISFKAKNTEITAAYPQTGNKAIDSVLAAYAAKVVADFKNEIKGDDANMPLPGASLYLDLSYTVERNDAQMLGIVFTEDTFEGGAHPNHEFRTFNFLLPDGAQVFLGEILDGKNGVGRLSRIVTAKLIKEIGTGDNAMSDKESVQRGAAPRADNFANFVMLPGKLHLYFSPYAVASYAAGPQETTVDLQQLKDVIRADWRAPAPSFDCRKAKSNIEKAVCGDAKLARLDRQMAEAYESKLAEGEFDPDAAKKLKADQRAWLAATMKACNIAAPGPCLANAYAARIAVIRTP